MIINYTNVDLVRSIKNDLEANGISQTNNNVDLNFKKVKGQTVCEIVSTPKEDGVESVGFQEAEASDTEDSVFDG